MALPQLAGWLAGGFADLENIRGLPGMTRSVAWTLARVWNADVALADRAEESARLRDLTTIEARVRANLPIGVLTPRDLRDAALARLDHAPTVLGAVELDHVVQVGPVWRPLLNALARKVQLAWRNPGAADIAWFAGGVESDPRPTPAAPQIVSCATPHAEAVEALRWMRELMASGRARPEEIAICATATEDWDDHMLVLATDAGLPLHFSHGVPALASREGQACGALADVLLNGLSQDRVRRLFGHAAGRTPGLGNLPSTWAQGLQPGAVAAAGLLWPPNAQVIIPGAGVRIRGSIDRLDFNSARNGVRVSDYKTGAEPQKAEEIVLRGGAETGTGCARGLERFSIGVASGPGDLFPNQASRPRPRLRPLCPQLESAMTQLADHAARLRALTELDSTLLVEAAAGTGKTALMASRLTMLLARGAEPRSIAAITFTELAAGALGARVHRYVDELLAGQVPEPLQPALPEGLTDAQHQALSAAAAKLYELTATTIHAFCQTIICSYAVEADIDTGARILDAAHAEAAFDAVFEQWFRRRLNGPARADDPIAALSQYDPHHVVAPLQALARFRLEHREPARRRPI